MNASFELAGAGSTPAIQIKAMPLKILVVDDDLSAIRLMSKMLMELGDIQFATNGVDALRLVRESPPSVIVLDAEMPGMGGFDVCMALKADASTEGIPVIFVTSHSAADFEITGFELGAADFIAKPVSAALLKARVKTQLRLSALTRELRRVATTDALTQVANRGRFDEALGMEWRRCRREGADLSLMMIDVDHFKLFNDRYGHPAGDVCLTRVAGALRDACLRPSDLVARYGGEEFVLLMPQTPRFGAVHMASRVLEAVASLGIAHERSSTAAHVTVSLGLACFDAGSVGWQVDHGESRFADDLLSGLGAEDLTRAADRALYAAKAAGRARAFIMEDDGPRGVSSLRDFVPSA